MTVSLAPSHVDLDIGTSDRSPQRTSSHDAIRADSPMRDRSGRHLVPDERQTRRDSAGKVLTSQMS
jgi:hypothetical protein